MKIGCAIESITPATPVYLAGFGVTRRAEEVHDDLFAKVVLMEGADGYYGVISFDLLCVDHLLLERLKTGMEQTGFNSDRFLITCTHTHSGPCGTMDTGGGLAKGLDFVMGLKDMALIEGIVEKTLKALKEAADNCKDTRIRVARGILSGVGKNRNNKDLKGDEDLFLAELEQEDGKRILLMNFACHPTVLSHENLSVSADFPGAVNRLMAEKGYAFTVYLNGSCGDISTRFTREGKGFPEVERYGRLIVDKLEELLLTAKEAFAERVEADSFQVRLRLKESEDPERARQDLELAQKRVEEAKRQGIQGSALRLIEARRDGALMSFHYARNRPQETHHTVRVSVLRVNKELFIGIPGELFSELSNGLKDGHIHFVGYTGEHVGYFGDKAAYDCLNYEAMSSPFERGQPEILVEKIRAYICSNSPAGVDCRK